jgi:hypothetical protein
VKDARWRPDNGRWLVLLAVAVENATADTVSQGSWLYPSLVVAQRPWQPTCYSATSGSVDRGLVADVLVGFDVACAPVGPIALEVENGRVDLTDESTEPAGSTGTADCRPA